MNVNVNVMIEDFMGYICNNCLFVSDIVKLFYDVNLECVFVVVIYIGFIGMGMLQELIIEYLINWINLEGFVIGIFFGFQFGFGFQGNLCGIVNCVLCNNQFIEVVILWLVCVMVFMNVNNNCVNFQFVCNYFDVICGVFFYVEVDLIVVYNLGELKLVMYVIEDFIIGDQKMLDNMYNYEYVYCDVMCGCIDGEVFGCVFIFEMVNSINGNYYVMYSYKLLDQYNL